MSAFRGRARRLRPSRGKTDRFPCRTTSWPGCPTGASPPPRTAASPRPSGSTPTTSRRFTARSAADSYLENVSQHGDDVDFYDTSYTQNGRATFPFRVIESAATDDIEDAHFLLILNKNENVIPAVAKLEGPQAAAFFMLGETQGTSAGGADEAGKFLRVPGTNPFFPMPHDLQGNRFLELLEELPLEVYLMNTGRVGGPESDERSKKVKIKHSSAIVKGIAEGTIEWERDPISATWSPVTSRGSTLRTSNPPPSPPLRGDGPDGELDAGIERLKNARAEFLGKFPSLSEESSSQCISAAHVVVLVLALVVALIVLVTRCCHLVREREELVEAAAV